MLKIEVSSKVFKFSHQWFLHFSVVEFIDYIQ